LGLPKKLWEFRITKKNSKQRPFSPPRRQGRQEQRRENIKNYLNLVLLAFLGGLGVLAVKDLNPD
jgi:hypothetical protein